MRVCVVGCGAIGGLYAGHLAMLPDTEVWAYDADEAHVDAMQRDGLRLTGAVRLTARVQARADAGTIPPCELGILATKGTATAAAIAATAELFVAGGAVCSVQNGIGNEEVIARRVPRVMRGVTLPAGRIAAPGVIHVDALGPTWIGPFEPSPAAPEQVAALAALLAQSGLETRALTDVRGAQWTKLLFNAATNPLCALTGLTHGGLCQYPPTRQLVGELLREGQAVAGALAIELDADPGELVDEAARVNPHHRPSMLQDVAGRRATEIGTLNGGIVDAGRAVGVPAPQHEAIVALIRGLERSWTS